jgi:hypothetical protein
VRAGRNAQRSDADAADEARYQRFAEERPEEGEDETLHSSGG